MDPRNVKLAGHNLTIIYMENGKVFQTKVLDMNHSYQPYEIFEVSANQEMFGIYNDEGVELWPSDCVAIGKYLDAQTSRAYAGVVQTAKLGEITSKGAKREKSNRKNSEGW